MKKSSAFPRWLYKSPRILCIFGFVCLYLFSITAFVSQASATTMSAPGGQITDPVVRQVDIAQLAVVRIITTLNARLTVTFTANSAPVTFPQGGGTYPIEGSGSGAFISANGDLLTADHVVNPPHDSSLDQVVDETAGQDVADYINSHFQVDQPYSPDEAAADLEAGLFQSSATYGAPSSKVYLNTAYTGSLNATKVENLPAVDDASVDQIVAQSSFEANDVAIIHVSGMNDMPSIQLGDSSQVAVQDSLTVIGFPGLGDVSTSPTNLLTASVNKIYVSAIKTTDTGSPVIQVGGDIEQGDSGGPALDDAGNIVGTVSFSLNDGSESGTTSFLQASNSALSLIHSANISTAPGAFELAWTQAINDYSSSAANHWHKAAQELQSLATRYPTFQGASQYLAYAQAQAAHEHAAVIVAPSSKGGVSPLLIVFLIVIVLIILGIVLIIARQRRQVASAGAGAAQVSPMPFGNYPAQQSGYGLPSGVYPPVPTNNYVSGVYPPTPDSYGAPVAGISQPTPVNVSTSGAYPPIPANYGAPVAGISQPTPVNVSASGVYPSIPANYGAPITGISESTPADVSTPSVYPSTPADYSTPIVPAATPTGYATAAASTSWYEQPASQVPQTPRVAESDMPQPLLPSQPEFEQDDSAVLTEPQEESNEPTVLIEETEQSEPVVLSEQMEQEESNEPIVLIEQVEQSEPIVLIEQVEQEESNNPVVLSEQVEQEESDDPIVLIEQVEQEESDDPTVLIEQVEQSEPVVLSEQMEQEESNDPTVLIEQVEQSEPVVLSEQTEQEESNDPTVLIEQVEQSDPTVLNELSEPGEPISLIELGDQFELPEPSEPEPEPELVFNFPIDDGVSESEALPDEETVQAREMPEAFQFPIMMEKEAVVSEQLPSNSTWSTLDFASEDEPTLHPSDSVGTPLTSDGPATSASLKENETATETIQKTSSVSLLVTDTWIASCGHANTPDVRFCRVCGQAVQTAPAQDENESEAH